ncbi:hypothetical protein MED121_22717 [Marinomonas sp. MED121]|uniref:hypothetical protein n=1 Tax=Marinomonas sp. MED121 TaxID=314277 RepID=UPI000068FDAD|nr:hypothetical protein [Marinomonas sp. MED121]EAQ65533.1 hypothetical protein MED121_22717 [Marinomonas sp. MED121]
MQIDRNISAYQTSLAGIQKAEQQMSNAARDVAASSATSPDTERPVQASQDMNQSLIKQQEAKLQFEASAKALEASDETLGSLIDIRV